LTVDQPACQVARTFLMQPWRFLDLGSSTVHGRQVYVGLAYLRTTHTEVLRLCAWLPNVEYTHMHLYADKHSSRFGIPVMVPLYRISSGPLFDIHDPACPGRSNTVEVVSNRTNRRIATCRYNQYTVKKPPVWGKAAEKPCSESSQYVMRRD
jgi:hypothetical protein